MNEQPLAVPVSRERIAELRRLYSDSTPGEWRAEKIGNDIEAVSENGKRLTVVLGEINEDLLGLYANEIRDEGGPSYCLEPRDRVFIANARKSFPALLDAAERAHKLAEENAKLRRAVRDAVFSEDMTPLLDALEEINEPRKEAP